MAWSEFGSIIGHESMDPTCLVTSVQASGSGATVLERFSWHTLGMIIPINHHMDTTSYLSIVADHVHPFMKTIYSSSNGYIQIMTNVTKVILNWFHEQVQHSSVAHSVISSESNRQPLGCGRTGYPQNGSALEKSAGIM